MHHITNHAKPLQHMGKSLARCRDPRRALQARLQGRFQGRIDVVLTNQDRRYRITHTELHFLAPPAAVRKTVYEYIIVHYEPILPPSIAPIASTLDHVLVVQTIPIISHEIYNLLPHYLHFGAFTFELCTQQRRRGFLSWCEALGPHASNVCSLIVKHWTA